jgi:hypothetical protein
LPTSSWGHSRLQTGSSTTARARVTRGEHRSAARASAFSLSQHAQHHDASE